MKKNLVDIFCDKLLELDSDNKKFMEFLNAPNKKVLYGIGNQAHICRSFLMDLGYQLEYFIVSEGNSKTDSKLIGNENPVYWINEVPDELKDHDILIALNEKFNEEIEESLKKNNFKNIYWSDNWFNINKVSRVMLYLVYEDYMALKIPGYSLENEIIEYKNFRIRSCKGQPLEYGTMLSWEYNDLIAPALFDDYSNLTEGPYEWSKVTLNEDDIVLDVGANIGIFSSVAASKGCNVYAFEPMPTAIKLLEQNAALYENINIYPYALSDEIGKIEFYTAMEGEIENLGVSSILDRLDDATIIEVQALTVDEFVNREKLNRVDFIKADIEGAERNMLRGAKKTLAEFAPKLALCTYHLPDDKEVMERLILEANPNYIVEHKWGKLYAYVPNEKR